jgi:hypothetical protein
MDVRDDGGDRLRVEWRGMDHTGRVVLRHAFEVPAAGRTAGGPLPAPDPTTATPRDIFSK